MNKQELLIKLVSMIIGSDETSSGDTEVNRDKREEKGRYIVIGNRGNIVVGDLTIVGEIGYLSNAFVIRRWGTTKGLGELALEGKQSETILDKCGDFEFHVQTTCGMIKVKSDL